MPKLDPTAASSSSANNLPAGVRLLGMTWFERRVSNSSGKEYLSVKLTVIDGRHKGASFYTAFSLDLSKNGAVRRWQILCEVLGITEEFELGSKDEGTEKEGDANIRRLFLNRAFKADVAVVKNGQYTNHELKSIAFPRQYTDADKEAIRSWEERRKQRSDDFGDPDDGPVRAEPESHEEFGDDDFDAPF